VRAHADHEHINPVRPARHRPAHRQPPAARRTSPVEDRL